jgi:hypothetical protein
MGKTGLNYRNPHYYSYEAPRPTRSESLKAAKETLPPYLGMKASVVHKWIKGKVVLIVNLDGSPPKHMPKIWHGHKVQVEVKKHEFQ